MCRGTPSAIVRSSVSASGGQPTGTTAAARALRIRETASPSRKICTEWPASANALACKNANAAFVGSSEPQALLMSKRIRPPLLVAQDVVGAAVRADLHQVAALHQVGQVQAGGLVAEVAM